MGSAVAGQPRGLMVSGGGQGIVVRRRRLGSRLPWGGGTGSSGQASTSPIGAMGSRPSGCQAGSVGQRDRGCGAVVCSLAVLSKRLPRSVAQPPW
ncbi:UNVERIFIED_CONTAM: hypothetical protein K2H54_002928 [Gekko kuhli]